MAKDKKKKNKVLPTKADVQLQPEEIQMCCIKENGVVWHEMSEIIYRRLVELKRIGIDEELDSGFHNLEKCIFDIDIGVGCKICRAARSCGLTIQEDRWAEAKAFDNWIQEYDLCQKNIEDEAML